LRILPLAMAITSTFVVPSSSPATPGADPFAQAAADAFSAARAATETYTPLEGAPMAVQVLYERGTVDRGTGVSRVVDRTTRAHLLKAELGRAPRKGETLTDGERTLVIDKVESDDEAVVVAMVKSGAG